MSNSHFSYLVYIYKRFAYRVFNFHFSKHDNTNWDSLLKYKLKSYIKAPTSQIINIIKTVLFSNREQQYSGLKGN